jgi:hypothetical protein
MTVFVPFMPAVPFTVLGALAVVIGFRVALFEGLSWFAVWFSTQPAFLFYG